MSRSLLKSGVSLSVLTLLSRIFGLIREIIKSAFLGTGPLADAFTIAFMIPNLLRRIFAENSITVAFIPTFQGYRERETKSGNSTEMREFLSAVFTMVSFSASAAVILGIIFSNSLIPLLFPHIADKNAAVLLTRIMFPYLLLISVAAFFQGILNGVRIFVPTGVTPIFFNIAVIACTYFLSKPLANPATAMAVGVIAGGSLQMLIQLPFVLRAGFRFRFVSLKKTFSHPGTKRILTLIVPTLIGTAAYQINDLVSTALASFAGVGVAASLQYSIRLQELVLGIFVVSVSTVILPELSAHAAEKQWESFQTLLADAAKIIGFITIPAALFLFCSAEHLIILIYKSRQFDDESVRLTLNAFQWHNAGLFFIALNRILSASFYAQSDTKSPTIAGIACFGVNIIAAAVLVYPMSGGGIACALSLASAVNTGLLMWFLKKKTQINIFKELSTVLLFILKISCFSLLAAAPVYLYQEAIYRFFSGYNRIISQGIPLFINAAGFSVVVIGLMLLSGDRLILQILKKLKR